MVKSMLPNVAYQLSTRALARSAWPDRLGSIKLHGSISLARLTWLDRPGSIALARSAWLDRLGSIVEPKRNDWQKNNE